MRIGGFQKLTLLDFPDKVAATIFFVGCNFNCSYCHNPELVLPQNFPKKFLSPENIFTELEQRKAFLDGVCLTGGEPLLQPDLTPFIKKIKQMGLQVKLDTNGTNPQKLQSLIEQKLVDYVAMDVKAPLAKYHLITKTQIDLSLIEQSIKLLLQEKVAYEFRTTVVPGLLSAQDIVDIARLIVGAKKYKLQKGELNKPLVDASLQGGKSYSYQELESMRAKAAEYVTECVLLGI